MASTIVRTFSLLTETDRKLDELTKSTFRRNKGDVIDWLVNEKYLEIQGKNNDGESQLEPEPAPADIQQ
jgi:hypothetical protein